MSETPTNVTPPPDLTYGYVDGRIILAIGDRSDAGRMPDPVPADGMTVTFTPANTILKVASPTPATVIKQPIVCSVDANGYLIDGQGARGVWLVTGTYKVTYSNQRAIIPPHDIDVTTGHTEVAPLDLTTAMPPGGPVLTPSEYAELNGRIAILEAGGTTDPEIVRDVIGAAMVAGSGIQITVNDAGDSITIASTAVLPTRQVIAGTGLTGGGDLSADRTLTVAYGTAAGTAAQGNDSRIVGAVQTTRTITAGTGLSGGGDLSANRTLAVAYGTTAGTAAQGNDSRLSDARTPTAHEHTAADVDSGASSDGQVLTSDGAGGAAWETLPGGNVQGVGVSTVWAGSQAAYDAISTPDPSTIYFVTG